MSEKVLLMPTKVVDLVKYSRRCTSKSPSRVMEFFLEQADSYIMDWLESKDNMKKLVEVVYSNLEPKETLDFIPFKEMMERFMKGQVFGIYEEAEKVPFKSFIYDKETQEIFELVEDAEGKFYLPHVRNPINGDRIHYKKQRTTETPFDYATKKDSFFNFHFINEKVGK